MGTLVLAEVGVRRGGKRLYRATETGSANTLLTSTLPADTYNAYRIVSVEVAYSATPTQAGVTTALDSGAGAGYDATLNTGSANARYTSYVPSGELLIGKDDGLVVSAPAGGAGVTAGVSVYLEDA
jgi:hypothetical protein